MTPTSTTSTEEPARTRPRVEGEREREILEATLEALVEHGYDKLSFDAVAATAKASKATLYRRWPAKVDLVVDAMQLMLGVEADRAPDTGDLRGDLIAQACAKGGLADDRPIRVFASLMNSMQREPELHDAIITRLIAPKMAAAVRPFRAAQQRGEIGDSADLDTLARLLPAISIHEAMLTGSHPSQDRLVTLVDSVVLPACAATLQRD
ncbi:TetR-like C-terminal domain-containing protein [Pedococcus sp. KACC 23699]|uniref:TetR-like C-terminal domain-containing protein n=1 Tax=Pedococcus sp. KACC 23699 TaxID=3149228 RepID=A0AAU7JR46_9MICO